MADQPLGLVECSPEKLAELRRWQQRMVEAKRQFALRAPARPRPWHDVARPSQLPPEGNWGIWLVLAGRGFGKTRLAAEWIAEQAARNPDTEWAIVAPTWRDCKKVCLEGSSGLLKALLPGELESVNASDLIVRLTNGSKIYGYSADGYERLRGSNLAGAWVDEAAVMASVSDMFADALMPALRIGENPRVLITTTPRPIALLKELVARTDGSVAVVRGSTWDNAANLSKVALAEMRVRYEGTRTGRQELLGELLEDVEGALWSREWVDETRVKEAPPLVRIVVGVDPAVTSGEKSDSTGIVVAGRSADGHLYILENCTMKGTPQQCMAAVVKAYRRWSADRVVGEVNNGGDYIGTVLASVDQSVAYSTVRATRGKTVRAEPISALWEQGRGHIVGLMPELEDQMCSFTTDTKESPDDLDACFVAGTPVLTSHGEVPIEQIVPGELVWTRAGWKPVLRSECTKRDAEVMTVELSSGQSLTGTPNHRIWTQNGWSRLDALVWGDTLEEWQTTPLLSSSMASPTRVTRTVNSTPIACTTRHPGTADTIRCTAMSGAPRTQERKSPSGGTYITKTTTRSITTPATSFFSHLRRISSSMLMSTRASSWALCVPMLSGSDRWPQSGIAARLGTRGTWHTGSAHGKAGNTSLAPVSAAGMGIKAPSATRTLGIARGLASSVSATGPAGTSTECHALCAAPNSGSPSTGRNPRRAAVHVGESRVEPQRRDVYDLMVADQHEFVASGVIVHNCVWACHELNVGTSALMYLNAISTMCGECDTPNSKKLTNCTVCGAALPDAA